ncbi:MAG: hypothetical protein RR379_12310, partial [Clostridia bacterium]
MKTTVLLPQPYFVNDDVMMNVYNVLNQAYKVQTTKKYAARVAVKYTSQNRLGRVWFFYSYSP